MKHNQDWLYLKIYTGAGDDIGPLLPVASEWMRTLTGVSRWHFLRYVDALGHHLRLRLRGTPEDADVWYQHIGELDRAVRAAEPRTAERIIRDPMTESGQHSGIAVSVYSPELAKYGGAASMDDTERHFHASSESCVAANVWRWQARQRLGQTVHYLQAVEKNLGEQPGALSARVVQRWAPRIRYTGIDMRKLSERLPGMRRAIVVGEGLHPYLQDLSVSAANLVNKHTGREGVPASFPLDVVHMDINRIGVNPLEECLAAMLAAPEQAR